MCVCVYVLYFKNITYNWYRRWFVQLATRGFNCVMIFRQWLSKTFSLSLSLSYTYPHILEFSALDESFSPDFLTLCGHVQGISTFFNITLPCAKILRQEEFEVRVDNICLRWHRFKVSSIFMNTNRKFYVLHFEFLHACEYDFFSYFHP